MSRRVWALVVGGALAIGAVIAGSFIAIGQAGDSSTTPTGDSTKLRLEAVNDEVSCGSVAAVHIYLDDLETREAAHAGLSVRRRRLRAADPVRPIGPAHSGRQRLATQQ